jgi:hypothetical protein
MLLELKHFSWIVTIQVTLNVIVGIVMRLWPGQPRNCGSVASRDKRVFSPEHPDQLWVLLILLFSGYRGYFLGVEWLGPEAEYSPLYMENMWSFTSTLPHTFTAYAGTILHLLCYKFKYVVHHFFKTFRTFECCYCKYLYV